jgi:hypothetical protein
MDSRPTPPEPSTGPNRPPGYHGRHRITRPVATLGRRLRAGERMRLRATQLAVGILIAAIAVAWLAFGTPHPQHATTHGDAGVPVGLPGVATRLSVHHDGALLCGDFQISVTASPSSHHGLTVFGQLCAAAGFHVDRAELDLPDAGYNHQLYAWPASRYDYARATDGRVTLAIDPLGTGASSHPDGTTLTVATQAWIAHQLVTDLHTGILGDSYRQVIEVGSGLGAQIATTEAARWHDVAAVIVLDAGHTRTLPSAHLTAAATDPRVRGQAWARHGYLMLPAGSRCAAGYYPPGTPAGMCGEDENLQGRQPIPVGVAAAPADLIWTAAQVTAPVLVVLDARDPDTCPTAPCTDRSPTVRQLAAAFRAAPRRDLWIQPDAGRIGLLHHTAPQLSGLINRWLRHQILHPLDHTTIAATTAAGSRRSVAPSTSTETSHGDGDTEADMSRYHHSTTDSDVEVVVGWDPLHATFYAHTYDRAAGTVVESLTEREPIIDPRTVHTYLSRRAAASDWLDSQLYTDVLHEPRRPPPEPGRITRALAGAPLAGGPQAGELDVGEPGAAELEAKSDWPAGHLPSHLAGEPDGLDRA